MNKIADTLATASGATPVAAKTIKSRGIINQKQARALVRAELAAAAAQHPDRVDAMTDRGIFPEYAESVVTDVGAARDMVALIVNSTTARKVATAAEKRTAKILLEGLREVQKAAKQKYARTNRLAMEGYFVGKHLNGNRPNLLQTSQAILEKVAADTLPGFTAAKVKKLKDARTAWVDTNAEQVAHASAAITARAELRTLLRNIEDRRLAIQLAADAEWPHTDDEHAGIRREFAMAPKSPVRV